MHRHPSLNIEFGFYQLFFVIKIYLLIFFYELEQQTGNFNNNFSKQITSSKREKEGERIKEQKMLCSLCMRERAQSIQLPCSHIICPECIPKNSFTNSVFHYQCQTCLAYHEIPLNDSNTLQLNQHKATGDFRAHDIQSSQSQSNYSEKVFDEECVYCWSCEEGVGLREYVRGRHHAHEVSTFQQALPRIKSRLVQQLRNVKQIKSYFQQLTYKLSNNSLLQQYNDLVGCINNYFNKQFEILEIKRSQIVDELKHNYELLCDEAEENIDKLNPLIYQVEDMQKKIDTFLSDKLPFVQINPLWALIQKVDILQEVSADGNLFQLGHLPQFVAHYNIQKYVHQCCGLFTSQKLSHNQSQIQFQPIKNLTNKSTKNILPQTQLATKPNKSPKQPQVQQKSAQFKIQRKVKLLQKLKDKMKYSTSMRSTGFL